MRTSFAFFAVGLAGCSSPAQTPVTLATDPALLAEHSVAQKNGAVDSPKIIPSLVAHRISEPNPNSPASFHSSLCPIADAGETELDCPWAGMSRSMEKGESVTGVIQAQTPALMHAIREDQRERTWLALWGRSANWDEYAKKSILNHRIVDALVTPAGYPPRTHSGGIEIAHAGLLHTYGYLWSTLQTPFGFKRKRWVSGEIESGLKLSAGTFAPNPPSGTLFSNVTYFAGNVAFRRHPSERMMLENLKSRASSELNSELFSSLSVQTLQETPRGEPWVFQTDLVKLTSGHLLIYSLHNEKQKDHRLITMFPVEAGFAESLLDPKTRGAGQTIKLKYNAYLENFYGKQWRGDRNLLVAQ